MGRGVGLRAAACCGFDLMCLEGGVGVFILGRDEETWGRGQENRLGLGKRVLVEKRKENGTRKGPA